MNPNVVYYWIGYAKAGKWVGTRGEWFLIDNPHYDELIETKAILPYDPEIVGMLWEAAEIHVNVLNSKKKGDK